MKTLLLIAVCFTAGLEAFAIPKNIFDDEIPREPSNIHLSTPVRVLLDKGVSAAKLKTFRNLYVRYGTDGKWQGLGKQATVAAKGKTLWINGAYTSMAQIYVRGGTSASDEVEYKTDRFRGALRFTLRDGKMWVTNILGIEDYVRGTLGSEMSPTWELEALKAQAVASRSYALYMISHPKHALYDVEKNTQDQVYTGVEAEAGKVREAVLSTTGKYLGVEGDPIKAYFHSRCGGHTAATRDVWNYANQVYGRGVPCPYCRKNPYQWSVTLPNVQITEVTRNPSGRIATMMVNDRKLTSDEFRSLYGYAKVKSAWFEFTPGLDEIHISGVGAGHGVGMCQWGARHLAKSGKPFQWILAHFYPNAQLYRAR